MQGKRGQDPEKVKIYDREARRRIDAELAEKTVDFMKRSVAAERPFFAYLPFTLVHLPTLPHPDFDGKTGNGRWADVLAELDHRAGQVLDAIDDLDVRENTLVIWMSENGPEEIFPHNGTTGPWRGTQGIPLTDTLDLVGTPIYDFNQKYILITDVGAGMTSTFGGEIQTPILDRVTHWVAAAI